MDVAALADRILSARRAGRVLAPLTDELELDLPAAYAVQRAVLARRLSDGEQQIGWKIGYTSAAMRRQMGIEQPNYGPLTDHMLLESGNVVPDDVVQPKVEPEVMVVVSGPVSAGMSLEAVHARCRELRVALEVVDPVWAGYRFRIADNTADGSSAAYAVRGPELPRDATVGELGVVLEVDGVEQHRGSTPAVMGHPLEAVRWLANALAAYGRELQADDVVLTGGITPAVDLPRGSVVTARFDGGLDVRTRRR